MRDGRGSFRLRAAVAQEKEKGGGWHLLVSEIPYGVQKGKLIEQIARSSPTEAADPRRREGRERRGAAADPRAQEPQRRSRLLLESLYRMTDLEVRFPLNLNVLDATRTPLVMSLKEALAAWLEFQFLVLVRRSRVRIGKIDDRLEMVEGFIIAFLNLDRVIEIIRTRTSPSRC
jgi:topoisomerase IV subunit A